MRLAFLLTRRTFHLNVCFLSSQAALCLKRERLLISRLRLLSSQFYIYIVGANRAFCKEPLFDVLRFFFLADGRLASLLLVLMSHHRRCVVQPNCGGVLYKYFLRFYAKRWMIDYSTWSVACMQYNALLTHYLNQEKYTATYVIVFSLIKSTWSAVIAKKDLEIVK